MNFFENLIPPPTSQSFILCCGKIPDQHFQAGGELLQSITIQISRIGSGSPKILAVGNPAIPFAELPILQT